jgi:hypothetical protein
MNICKKCNEKLPKDKKIKKCPSCDQQLESSDAFLRTEENHKNWYNVPGKMGKQRGKPKRDMNTKDEKK